LIRIKSAVRETYFVAAAASCCVGRIQMMDLLMLAIGLGLFALTVGYAYACERL
jgi:hypothetical protein